MQEIRQLRLDQRPKMLVCVHCLPDLGQFLSAQVETLMLAAQIERQQTRGNDDLCGTHTIEMNCLNF